jgi:hypothetical protein
MVQYNPSVSKAKNVVNRKKSKSYLQKLNSDLLTNVLASYHDLITRQKGLASIVPYIDIWVLTQLN